jgi:hypothetical protein
MQHLGNPNNGLPPISNIKKSKDFDDSRSTLLKEAISGGKVHPLSDNKVANVES